MFGRKAFFLSSRLSHREASSGGAGCADAGLHHPAEAVVDRHDGRAPVGDSAEAFVGASVGAGAEGQGQGQSEGALQPKAKTETKHENIYKSSSLVGLCALEFECMQRSIGWFRVLRDVVPRLLPTASKNIICSSLSKPNIETQKRRL